VFSAFKVHHQTKAMQSLLLDKKGNVVPFSKFKKEALKISDHQNKNWLRTEYNTAKRRAAIGAKFTKFKATAHLYPNIKWTPSRSKKPSDNHRDYWGTILPIDHPFWSSNFPGNRWNCKCNIQRTKAPVTGSDSIPKTTTPPKGLDGNPAFTGQIIAKSHPVFKGLTEVEEKSAIKVVTKQTKQDVIKWSKTFIKDSDKGVVIKRKSLTSGKLTIKRKDIKTLSAKITDPFLSTYALVMKEDVINWEYLGYSKVVEGKHSDANLFTYYKTSYGDRTIYINVKDTKIYGERPYNIMLNIDESKLIKKKLPKTKKR